MKYPAEDGWVDKGDGFWYCQECWAEMGVTERPSRRRTKSENKSEAAVSASGGKGKATSSSGGSDEPLGSPSSPPESVPADVGEFGSLDQAAAWKDAHPELWAKWTETLLEYTKSQKWYFNLVFLYHFSWYFDFRFLSACAGEPA
jgi:hypothetical protein